MENNETLGLEEEMIEQTVCYHCNQVVYKFQTHLCQSADRDVFSQLAVEMALIPSIHQLNHDMLIDLQKRITKIEETTESILGLLNSVYGIDKK